MHNCNIILSLSSFLKVVCSLLSNSNQRIRKRTIMMLDERVKAMNMNFEELIVSDFSDVLQGLVSIVKDQSSDLENIQHSLLAISTLASIFGKKDPENYFNILEILIDKYGLLHDNELVIATSLSPISALIAVLNVRIIPLIPRFIPCLFSIAEIANAKFKSSGNSNNSSATTILMKSILLTFATIIESVPLFVTSYVPQFVRLITDRNLNKMEGISKDLDGLSSKLGTKIEHQTLFPIVSKCLPDIISSEESNLIHLLVLLDVSIKVTPSSKILDLRAQWLKCFLVLFDFRSEMKIPYTCDMEAIEDGIINTFKLYTMKMNEKVFRPLFIKIVSFCLTENPSDQKVNFFFKLVNVLLDTLKSIFVPYTGNILDSLLLILNDASQKHLSGIQLQTWVHALSILKKTFIYDNDSNNFIPYP